MKAYLKACAKESKNAPRTEITDHRESKLIGRLLEKMDDVRFIIPAKPESGFGDALSVIL